MTESASWLPRAARLDRLPERRGETLEAVAAPAG
jgi:hypothetical protein